MGRHVIFRTGLDGKVMEIYSVIVSPADSFNMKKSRTSTSPRAGPVRLERALLTDRRHFDYEQAFRAARPYEPSVHQLVTGE